MNKKEVSEIKKQFKKDNTILTYITGCYVNQEKEMTLLPTKNFLSLPDEEQFKYMDIFKKALSGKLDKNLIAFEFEDEINNDLHQRLLDIRDMDVHHLNENEILKGFYQDIIDNCNIVENYAILIGYNVYDVPTKASDGDTLEDSDETYHNIICCICPVTLTKGGLSYQNTSNGKDFHERIQDLVAEAPLHAFMFPAFTDRQSDIHNLLYYTKKPANIEDALLQCALGCKLVMDSESQKSLFDAALQSLDNECTFENVQSIHENLQEKVNDIYENPEDNAIDKNGLLRLLDVADLSEDTIQNLEKNLDGNINLKMTNLLDNKFTVKTSEATISVKSDMAGIVERKTIDGVPCIVIPIHGDCMVNGVIVK